MSNLLQRALRSLEASPLGSEIAGFFRRDEVRKKISTAALTGRPPVAAISRDLLQAIPNLNDDPTAKRRIGLLIGALLEADGFELDRSGVRITDPLFATGSTYRRKTGQPSSAAFGAGEHRTNLDSASLAKRLAQTFDRDEANELLAELRLRFPDLF